MHRRRCLGRTLPLDLKASIARCVESCSWGVSAVNLERNMKAIGFVKPLSFVASAAKPMVRPWVFAKGVLTLSGKGHGSLAMMVKNGLRRDAVVLR